MISARPSRTFKQRVYDAYRRLAGGYARPEPSAHNGEKKGTKKILYVVSRSPARIVNADQTIDELVLLSRYQYDVLNVHAYLPIPPQIRYEDYDGVLIHNAVAYSTDILYRLDSIRKHTLAGYAGVKAMLKQDESFRTRAIGAYLNENGFDLVLGIMRPEQAVRYYGAGSGKLHYMQYLTGYVPESYHELPYRVDAGRSIDVGYRGSIQDWVFGSLGYEKQSIGADFEPAAKRRGLITDISSRWEDRFMGTAWLDFLGRCKAVLGVESGSDLMDADGEAEKRLRAYQKKHPKARPQELLALLAPFEERGVYRAISPRHFEAAACRAQQILFEGEYQGIFLPQRHYLPLKRDFSNANEVIDRMLDEKEREAMCERAFEEIILNPEYSFKTFVARFDKQLDRLFS